MNIDVDLIGKSMDTVNNGLKIANLLASKQTEKAAEKGDETTFSPHSQTVEVKVGDPESKKPMVLKEKTENNTYHIFPEGRELSEKECDALKTTVDREHEYRMRVLEFRIRQDEQDREERRERIEYERREAARRREDDRKFARKLGIGLGCAAVAGLGFAAFDFYSNSRHSAGGRVAAGGTAGVNHIPAEGSVE